MGIVVGAGDGTGIDVEIGEGTGFEAGAVGMGAIVFVGEGDEVGSNMELQARVNTVSTLNKSIQTAICLNVDLHSRSTVSSTLLLV